MFTGIIESLGKVESLQSVGGDIRLRIGTNLDMSDVFFLKYLFLLHQLMSILLEYRMQLH